MAVACIDCGKELALSSHGRTQRCKPCANREISKQKSAKLGEQDEWLVKMCLTRPITQVAKQMGLSRQQVYNRLAKAKERKEASRSQPGERESW